MSPLKNDELGKQCGVSGVSIWKIRHMETYKWVDGNGLAHPGRAGKLMPSQVRFIRNTTLERDLLAERFGLCTEQIARIQRKECYREVEDL